MLDLGGRLLAANGEAAELLPEPAGGWDGRATRCCQLFGCRSVPGPLGDACLSELARTSVGRLPEMRVDLSGDAGRSVWLTGAPLGKEHLVVIVRDGDPRDRRRRTRPHWTGEGQLRVLALGRTRVEAREGSIGGAWLEQRPGQILKFLVCERHRAVTVGEIAGAIWPDAGRRGLPLVRHNIHELRDRLEPDRPKRGPSSFVVSRQGGYALDWGRVSLDVEDFEKNVNAGMRAAAGGDLEEAKRLIERAMAFYNGDLFAEDPYCEWAITERESLRDLANEGLRALSELCIAAGDFDGAYHHVRALAEAEPYDQNVQRELIRLCLCRNRYSEANRRYQTLRLKMLRDLGEDLDFGLNELARTRNEPLPLR